MQKLKNSEISLKTKLKNTVGFNVAINDLKLDLMPLQTFLL